MCYKHKHLYNFPFFHIKTYTSQFIIPLIKTQPSKLWKTYLMKLIFFWYIDRNSIIYTHISLIFPLSSNKNKSFLFMQSDFRIMIKPQLVSVFLTASKPLTTEVFMAV